tara:strand:- start:502 stop:966 length:465 start_codon:yes stop_codon:yes gene_type:complete
MFPNKMLKSNVVRALILIAVAVAVIVVLKKTQPTSKYAVKEKMYAPTSGAPAPKGIAAPESASDCEMKAGTGLASSLLPREVASQENFGEFAPEDILAGQNFLEVRDQIGIPETTGGALRNANQSIRAEPPNPKVAFTWNNSTINTDNMQRPLV